LKYEIYNGAFASSGDIFHLLELVVVVLVLLRCFVEEALASRPLLDSEQEALV
jgi:hypothetical protein